MKRLKLVMIGNGMAGVRTLEELLKITPDLYDITVFGAEPHPNYNRILLSPVLAGEQTFDDIVLNDLAWYADHGIELRLARQVLELDPVRRPPFTQGSPIFPHRAADTAPTIVTRPRAAGATFIAQTHTPKFALCPPNFNTAHAPPPNPHDPATPGAPSCGGRGLPRAEPPAHDGHRQRARARAGPPCARVRPRARARRDRDAGDRRGGWAQPARSTAVPPPAPRPDAGRPAPRRPARRCLCRPAARRP